MGIQVGDCVQLLTGGCLMTADERYEGLRNGRIEISCLWFNDAGELKTGRFAERSLRVWRLAESAASPKEGDR